MNNERRSIDRLLAVIDMCLILGRGIRSDHSSVVEARDERELENRCIQVILIFCGVTGRRFKKTETTERQKCYVICFVSNYAILQSFSHLQLNADVIVATWVYLF